MHDWFPNYVIWKSFLALNACMDYIIWKLFYGGGTKRLKMYFSCCVWGARRTYGGAGRNSPAKFGPNKLRVSKDEAQLGALHSAPLYFKPAPQIILNDNFVLLKISNDVWVVVGSG